MPPDAAREFVFTAADDDVFHHWYLPEVERGTGAVTTQWLSFRFRLHRMVRHSPGSHFAVVLRARLGFDPDGRPASISGRGMTLGDTSLAVPPVEGGGRRTVGFGGARGAQIESFWPGGNFLFASTGVLPQGLCDEVWYRVQLHVNDARWIAFELGQDGHAPVRACTRDAATHPVIAGAQGALIALGRGPHESGDWSAEFRDIACGWF